MNIARVIKENTTKHTVSVMEYLVNDECEPHNFLLYHFPVVFGADNLTRKI